MGKDYHKGERESGARVRMRNLLLRSACHAAAGDARREPNGLGQGNMIMRAPLGAAALDWIGHVSKGGQCALRAKRRCDTVPQYSP